MTRDYETLDAIVVIASLTIIGGSVAGLMFQSIPQNNLPIIASLLGTLLGTIVGGYAGFRWGSSIASKQAAETAADTSKTATSALAQIAGAGPPSPAPPMGEEPEQLEPPK
jgi:hypothetical protein